MSSISLKTVNDLCDQLHICLIKAINIAMTEKASDDWFTAFKEFDKNQIKPILDSEHTSVYRMDLQACLKFFRFRGDYASIVFEYYGYNFFDKSEDAQKAQRMLYQLLDNIIHNVRNHLYAHANATMVQDGSDDSLRYAVYGPREAANDMLRLAEFFNSVTDDDGISFYSKMLSLSTPCADYSISETIAKEQIALSVGSFVDVCSTLGIPVVSKKDNEMFFSSNNYEGDVAKIKLHISQNYKETKPYVISDVIAAEALTVAVGDFVEACQKVGVEVSTNVKGMLVMLTDNYSGDVAKVKLCLKDKEPKPKTGLIIGIAAAVVVIAAVIALIIGMGGDDGNADPDGGIAPVQTTTDAAAPEKSNDVPAETPAPTETEAQTTAAPVRTISGKETFGTLTFAVNQEHDNNIVLELSNGDLHYKLGWVSDPTFILETVSGKKLSATNVIYPNPMKKIAPHSTSKIYLTFDDIEEDIRSIAITDVVTLDDRGLPATNNYATVVVDVEYK